MEHLRDRLIAIAVMAAIGLALAGILTVTARNGCREFPLVCQGQTKE